MILVADDWSDDTHHHFFDVPVRWILAWNVPSPTSRIRGAKNYFRDVSR